jgi:hypothetical protein
MSSGTEGHPRVASAKAPDDPGTPAFRWLA